MQEFFRTEILESPPYQVEFFEGIKLNQNECPWDLPIDLKVKITERLLRTDWNRYPTNDLVLLQKKIAAIHNLQADQIVISNGSNTIIQALINIISPRHKVLLLDPCFTVYEMQAVLHGNKVVKVPLSEDFELQTEKTITAIKKEKPGIVFIANPNAPTGTLFDKRSLYNIIQAAKCPVVIDEAYYPFTEETVVEWLNDFENLVVLRTFSKAVALAGVRCGFMMAHVEIASLIEKFLMAFRMSKISCVIIDEILENPGFVRENVKIILKERAKLFSKMQKINHLVVYPSEANFLLFKVPNAKEFASKLKHEKMLIRNVGNEESLKNCFRVTVGTEEENERFLEVLANALA